MKKTITGKFEKDSNFITVYADNRMYTIARATRECGSVAVGEDFACGGTLTQEAYDEMASKCKKVLHGAWGNGQDRKNALTAAGYENRHI